jgi:hypothetical protein
LGLRARVCNGASLVSMASELPMLLLKQIFQKISFHGLRCEWWLAFKVFRMNGSLRVGRHGLTARLEMLFHAWLQKLWENPLRQHFTVDVLEPMANIMQNRSSRFGMMPLKLSGSFLFSSSPKWLTKFLSEALLRIFIELE